MIEPVHCREEGCIGKYTPRGPRDFPRAGILHPEAREIARGRSPRAISRAEGGVFSNASRFEAVYGHSLIIIRKVLIFFLATDGAAIIHSFQVLAENPLICYCMLFTNIRHLVFFAQLILRVIPILICTSKLLRHAWKMANW